MKILIIDDERPCRDVIKMYLKKMGINPEMIFEAENVTEALSVYNTVQPDLVFLDIQLHELTGFDFLDQVVNQNFQLVFTTAYDQYAIKAFEYCALHYILKPVEEEALKFALDRAITFQLKSVPEKIEEAKFLYVNTESKSFNLNLAEITHIEADGSYSKIFKLDGDSIFSSKNLGEYEKNLPESFFRAHKSALVNLHLVKEIDTKNGTLLMQNDIEVPVSRRKKPLLNLALKGLKTEF